jgi:hypothetical protein
MSREDRFLIIFYFCANYKGWGIPFVISEIWNNFFTFALSILAIALIYLAGLLNNG